MGMKERHPILKLWILIFLTAPLALSMLALLPNQPIADELIHLPQIQSFMSGSMVLSGLVAMPPGFHYSIASIAGFLNLSNLTDLRAINATFTLFCPILFWLYLKFDEGQFKDIRSTQLLLSPIVWPFFFLLYTDLSSLLLVLASLVLVKRRHVIPAALICTISLAFRQNNIFWIALLWLIALVQTFPLNFSIKKNGFSTPKFLGALAQSFRKTAAFLIPLGAFALFIYLNGGVAMGNKDLHQTSGIYPTQIFFFLLVIWIILLPLHIHNLPAIFSFTLKNKLIIVGLGMLASLYLLTFDISHPYNFPSDYFIRNWMLYKLKDHPTCRLLAFIPMVWALLSIVTTRLKDPACYWLYPISLISLLPVHLIEQRYYIIPLALFLLFRLPISRGWEVALLAWGLVLSGLVTYGIVSMKIFL
jgi:alpha-1,2-glucosyltransferase